MFKNIFSFNGRIRRTEYGISFIIYWVGYIFIKVFSKGANGAPIVGLLAIPLVWFLWAQGAKRCHDIGKSGWWQLIPFFFFWLIFQNGDAWPNEYGLNPKNPIEYGADDYVAPYSGHHTHAGQAHENTVVKSEDAPDAGEIK